MHSDGGLELKKGGCYGLESDAADSPARLVWMLTPGFLR